MQGNRLWITLPRYHQNTTDINKIDGDWRTKIIHEEGYFDLDDYYASRYYSSWERRDANGGIVNGVVQEGCENVIKGTDGADEIHGLGGGDAIDGMGGNDIIFGGDSSDLLAGGGGSDIIKGGAGDDFIWANNHITMPDRNHPGERWKMPADGKKLIYAGPNWGVYIDHNDVMIFDGISSRFDNAADVGGDFLYGGDGSDYIEGDSVAPGSTEQGDDIIYGMAGNDYIVGGKGNDLIYGDGILRPEFLNSLDGALHGDDNIYGDADSYETGKMLDAKYHGNDTIYGGAGNDQISGGGGDDYLYGGDDDDIIWGDAANAKEPHPELNGNDHIWGDAGNDILDGGYGDDVIFGGDGYDQIFGDFNSGVGMNIVATDNSYNDTIYAGNGNDLVVGQLGDDLIYGGAGNDKLFGDLGWKNPKENRPQDNGNDTIYGEEGDDYIDGGYGNDYLDGGTGNDTVFGGGGNDVIYGGEGNDFLSGGNAMNMNDTDTAGGNDVIYGGAGNDTILGGEGDDLLQGDEGNDYLSGGNGNDRLYGGDGRDWLLGGKGNNYLNGGTGDDYFVFKSGDGVTTIEDYSGQSIVIVDVPLDNLSISAYEKGIKVTNGVNGDVIYLVGYYLDGRANSLDMNNLLFAQPNGGNSYITRSLQQLTDNLQHHNAARYDRIIEGNDKDNKLFGTAGKDLMYGYGGNDLLDGGDGNDILYGGAGNDQLFGGAGEDILEGGSGNDLLVGGSWQRDRYVFRAGYGRDEVIDQAANESQGDILDFVDYRSDELRLSRNGDDLLIGHVGSHDQVRLDNWFADASYRQYQIHTADGMHYTAAQVQQLVGAMATFSSGSSEGRIWAADEVKQFAPPNILAANCG